MLLVWPAPDGRLSADCGTVRSGAPRRSPIMLPRDCHGIRGDLQWARSTIGADTASGVVRPEGVDMDISNIELEPLPSSGSSGPPQRSTRAEECRRMAGDRPRRRRHRHARRARRSQRCRDAVVDRSGRSRTGRGPAGGVAGGRGGRERSWRDCLRRLPAHLGGSADSMERFVEHCRRSLDGRCTSSTSSSSACPTGAGRRTRWSAGSSTVGATSSAPCSKEPEHRDAFPRQRSARRPRSVDRHRVARPTRWSGGPSAAHSASEAGRRDWCRPG